jgi:D-beta-D-heptose 7-phosphate kinase/D-beta-D-heptose 1-phosphate adenosyltransferase
MNVKKPVRVGICSGYFDPLHVGHLENLKKARLLNDVLVVIVNNSQQTLAKKGYEFQKFDDRMQIISSLSCVDYVFPCIDRDGSVCLSLRVIADWARERYHKCEISFCKGGDRFCGEIPESKTCKEFNIKIIDGLGKKIRSSSSLVKRARAM